MRINAAQHILYDLGMLFPLYSENKQGRRNATYTKKGPGRRHHTTEAEKVLRASRLGLADCVTLLRNRGARTLLSPGWPVRRRGMWSLVHKGGKLYMRLTTGLQRVIL